MIRNPWGSTLKTDGIWGEANNCKDDDNNGALTDSYGDNCAAWYDAYPEDCGLYDTATFVARDLCCGCGAGTVTVDDTIWTDAYKALVPHSINPDNAADDGIFFLDKTEFLTCFDDY